VVGDVVGDVDLPIGPLSPQTAIGGAGVGVSVGLRLDSDVALDQDRLVQFGVWRTNTGVSREIQGNQPCVVPQQMIILVVRWSVLSVEQPCASETKWCVQWKPFSSNMSYCDIDNVVTVQVGKISTHCGLCWLAPTAHWQKAPWTCPLQWQPHLHNMWQSVNWA